jgi:hypothetical protein
MAGEPGAKASGQIGPELLEDYVSAVKTIRSVRGLIFIFLVLALLVPLASFAGAQFGNIERPDRSSPEASTAAEVAEPDSYFDLRLYDLADRTMRVAPFIARLMTLMLVVVYLVSTNVCLSGRLGGASDSVAAFFWAVFLMLLLIPWQSWIGGAEHLAIYYDLDTMLDSRENLGDHWTELLSHYVRFLVLPFVGLLTAVVADLRFGRCHREVMKRIHQKLEAAVH